MSAVMGRQVNATYRSLIIGPMNGQVESFGTLYLEVLERDGEPVGAKPYRVVRDCDRGREIREGYFATFPEALTWLLKTNGFGEYEILTDEQAREIYDELGWDG